MSIETSVKVPLDAAENELEERTIALQIMRENAARAEERYDANPSDQHAAQAVRNAWNEVALAKLLVDRATERKQRS